ncbi:hypothetical protein APHAL10511_001282 [Amanita phalloides]|nr:hypothetical protein APHAL10511_001282 [Amanita phalloides]
MHRHANRLPAIRSTCRQVATAAKLKPRNWVAGADSVASQASTSRKWFLPSQDTSASSKASGQQSNDRPINSQGLSQLRPSRHGSKHNSSQNRGEKPRYLLKTPSADALNKWTRPTKPAVEHRTTLLDGTDVLGDEHSDFQVNYGTNDDLRSSSDDSFRNDRRRLERSMFKERGSLLTALEVQDSKSTSEVVDVNVQRTQEKERKRRKQTLVARKRVDIYIPTTISVRNLARLLNVRLDHLQRRMRQAGMANEALYDHVLTADYAALLAEEFGRNPIISDEAAFDIHPSPLDPNPASLPTRPPVVAIMGHVDHGKTTLLDTLRSSSVAKGEAGGITQHIGAFSMQVHGDGKSDNCASITFLDTPGHAAFSAMRARGARVTDIIVLVVAADDGVMPQTREVIDLIDKEDGKIGVVVAINKIDKPGVDEEDVQKALLSENVSLEAFGGDVPCVNVSGLTGQGLPELVETIAAMAEMQDLRAEHDGPAHGYILESKVQKGLGPVATVLILRGQLQVGSHIISGVSQAKVRLMKDATGASIKVAYPGMAVTVSGWKTLPNAGEEVLQGVEADIKKAIANRQRKTDLDALLVDVDAINASRREEKDRRFSGTANGQSSDEPKECDDGPKELRLVVKADVSGSAEALVEALQGIGNNKAKTKIIFSGVGDVSEGDVMMAKAIDGTIIAFSVVVPRVIQTLAARSGVSICTSNVIYRLMDDVKQKLVDLLPVSVETAVVGEATVLQLFEIQVKSKETKKVAGCRVTNGVAEKAQPARVVRNGSVMHEGHLDTMRHLKEDVMEGDVIQIYRRIEKPGVL